MPKLPQLKIAEVSNSEFPFEVNVSATMSETGRRQRRRFKTKGEANGFVAALKRKHSLGIEREILLPGHVKKQALRAHELLKSELPEVSLLEAVEGYAAARRILAGVDESDCTVAAAHYRFPPLKEET